jgi:hypothetical protein
MELTPRDRDVLDFERSWWLVAAQVPKHTAIRQRLEISPAHYYSLLERLIDSKDAYAYDPLVVNRLRRRREERRRAMFTSEAPRKRRPR